ncbi:TDP-4-oxo-6-deoxy-alpha-D-glucose-3, 4-oxoisomerase [Aquicella siphonis]|uniref:TDP-4-oxo-6-deoxy-alpha-D-glucose-3, 4-oxoisomerase n=1 Tax=Aquicella siphonis TaxID=254247 RepID=A0A5E4PJ43_9COXI|nr:FdtA/QdtA family cupin domain-containing protein [Aquicella siphonis]VVC76478.1 TDP-4-oxo-6-deoxy-alpha-D-glucose-3, 4-oxoisomerase [Aquicella siphonis]
MTIKNCKLIHFNKIEDPRGSLTPIEAGKDIPFSIKRAYYLYDVPSGAARAGHAHKALEQIVLAISGSFDVVVKDGNESYRYHLNRPYIGLYLPNMVWREVDNFSAGAVCFVLASQHYDESDYYRDYESYLKAFNANHPV